MELDDQMGNQPEQSHNRRVDNKSLSYNMAEILLYLPMRSWDRQQTAPVARMLGSGGGAGWSWMIRWAISQTITK